jgi:hypothetical protein
VDSGHAEKSVYTVKPEFLQILEDHLKLIYRPGKCEIKEMYACIHPSIHTYVRTYIHTHTFPNSINSVTHQLNMKQVSIRQLIAHTQDGDYKTTN